MSAFNRLGLGSKLAIVATPFLAVAMGLIAITLWMSWQLDGGAAAVNEAGRMRMQGFRLSLAIATQDHAQIDQYTAEFERSLQVLRPQALVDRWATPERPLFNTYGPTEATVSASLAEAYGTQLSLAKSGPGEVALVGPAAFSGALLLNEGALTFDTPAGGAHGRADDPAQDRAAAQDGQPHRLGQFVDGRVGVRPLHGGMHERINGRGQHRDLQREKDVTHQASEVHALSLCGLRP